MAPGGHNSAHSQWRCGVLGRLPATNESAAVAFLDLHSPWNGKPFRGGVRTAYINTRYQEWLNVYELYDTLEYMNNIKGV